MDVREGLLKSESGQSVVEFLIFLPLLVGITSLLIRVNTLIQISIVDQKYARAQTFFLTYNHAYYPQLTYRLDPDIGLIKTGSNQMVLGVSDNLISRGATPLASTQNIVRPGKQVGNTDPQAEPSSRGIVRVRDTVALCTQNNFVSGQGGGFSEINSSTLGDFTQFDFCRSPFNE